MHVTVYGPFFFMETTITGIVYLDMLQQFHIPQLDEDDQEGCIHFQQDGAPLHYLEDTDNPSPGQKSDSFFLPEDGGCSVLRNMCNISLTYCLLVVAQSWRNYNLMLRRISSILSNYKEK
jgi:hypothetical protein